MRSQLTRHSRQRLEVPRRAPAIGVEHSGPQIHTNGVVAADSRGRLKPSPATRRSTQSVTKPRGAEAHDQVRDARGDLSPRTSGMEIAEPNGKLERHVAGVQSDRLSV